MTASSVASSSSSSVSESESRMTQGWAKKTPAGSGRPTTVCLLNIDERVFSDACSDYALLTHIAAVILEN